MGHSCAYICPISLQEALGFLHDHAGRTAVLSGGTDLAIAVRAGEVKPDWLMDVSRLDDMRGIRQENGWISVGAAVTFTELAASAIIGEFAPALSRAAQCVGSQQIRNVGTVGGNIANASPAADSVPVLVVHRARVVVRSAVDQRTVPIEDLIVGPYETNLRANELIVRVLLDPAEEGYRYSFQRITRRRAFAMARINGAVVGKADAGGSVSDVRMCFGSVLPRPKRMTAAENMLAGRVVTPDLAWQAAEQVSVEIVRTCGVRPSTEYKRRAVKGLVVRALGEVFPGGMPDE